MNWYEAYQSLKLKFTSGNNVPVERASITRAEFEALHGDFDAFEKSGMCPYCGSQIEDCK